MALTRAFGWLPALIVAVGGCAVTARAQERGPAEFLELRIKTQRDGSPLVCVRNRGNRSVWLPRKQWTCEMGYLWFGALSRLP